MSFEVRMLAERCEESWAPAYGLFSRVLEERDLRVGVEVGVAFGGHAEALLSRGFIKLLYGVDPYRHDPSYRDPLNLSQDHLDLICDFAKTRLSHFGDRYVLTRLRSVDAAAELPSGLDFVFIDGDHSLEGVRADLCAWYPKVRDGGVIGGHDYGHPNHPGVRAAVDRFFQRFDWAIRCEGEGIWWVEKKPQGISFVIPAFNCEETVAKSVRSVLTNNLEAEDEVILVNDGCSDSTPQILLSLAEQNSRVSVVTHRRNRGLPAARNTGVEHATNSMIFTLDSDNLLVPGSVASLRELIESSDCDVACFGELHYFKNQPANVTHKWVFAPEVTLADCLASSIVPPASGNYLFTKASWEKAGGYRVASPFESWGFGFTQLATGSLMRTLPGTHYLHRYGHDSLWYRASRSRSLSVLALQVVIPFLDLLCDSDVRYLFKNYCCWWENLEKRPLQLKNPEGPVRRGIAVQLSQQGFATRALRKLNRLLAFEARRK